MWHRRDLGPQSPAHRGSVVVVAVSEEASAGGGLLGWPPLMPASQVVSGDERAAPTRMQRWPGEGGAAAICDSQPHTNLQPAGAPSGGGWGAMPAALPSRAAADGLARPVGHR